MRRARKLHVHRLNDHLMEDEGTGFTNYRSKMAKQWDGYWIHQDLIEYDHPQKYIKAKMDPHSLRLVRPDELVKKGGAILLPNVGATSTKTATRGAAAHLYDLTLEEMAVGCTWIVR